MTDQKYMLRDINGKQVVVYVRQDKRLRKSSRWERQKDGSILLRIPYRFPKRQIGNLLDQVSAQLMSRELMAERRTDAELQLRAQAINRKYFGSKIKWKAIRWVGNMERRLGSCTNGGPTDGHIRISDKMKNWPEWVVDYVIAHELVHRLHDNHSQDFWDALTAGYPLTERARGFIRGVSFAESVEYSAD